MPKHGLFVYSAIAALTLLAAEKRVQMKDLPEPVQKTVLAQAKNAQLRGLAQEVENGKTFYEAETMVNGKSRDVLIDPSGAVVEVEEEIDLATIPEAAQKTLKTAAGAGKILKVEKVTKGSDAAGYEAVVEKGGKKSEIAVTPEGVLKK